MSTPPQLPDHVAGQIYPSDLELAQQGQKAPANISVGDEGKSGMRPDDLGRSTLSIGGTKVSIEQHMHDGTSPTLVPPEASREQLRFGDLKVQIPLYMFAMELLGLKEAEAALTAEKIKNVGGLDLSAVSNQSAEAMSLAMNALYQYSPEAGIPFNQLVSQKTLSILDTQLSSMNPATALKLRAAMGLSVEEQSGEKGGTPAVPGLQVGSTPDKTEDARYTFHSMDASAQSEYRYVGSFMAVIAKALALVSQIKAMMTNADDAKIKEDAMRDRADLEAKMGQVLRDIKKREDLRAEIKEKQNSFLNSTVFKVLLCIVMLVLMAALYVLLMAFIIYAAIFVVIMQAAIALAAISLICSTSGCSINTQVGKMACSLFGGDQQDAAWVGEMVACGGIFLLGGGPVNPMFYYYIYSTIKTKKEADEAKAKDKEDADRMGADAELDKMKASYNQQLANYFTIGKTIFSRMGSDDDKAEFLAAITALLTMLIALISVMQSGGGGQTGVPKGIKGSEAPGPTTAQASPESKPNYLIGQISMGSAAAGTVTLSPEALMTMLNDIVSKLTQFIQDYKDDPEKAMERSAGIEEEFSGMLSTVGSALDLSSSPDTYNEELNAAVYKAVFDVMTAIDPSYATDEARANLWAGLENAMNAIRADKDKMAQTCGLVNIGEIDMETERTTTSAA